MWRKNINQNSNYIYGVLFVIVCVIFVVVYYYYGTTKYFDNHCVNLAPMHELRISNCSYPRSKVRTSVYKLKLMNNVNMILHGYPPWDTISRIVSNKGNFKPEIDRVIYSILSRNPSALFIDIGATLGMRSLQVANYKNKVIAIEPLEENVYRFCRSKIDNKMTNEIAILHYAIADRQKTVQLAEYNGCMGCSFIADDREAFRSRRKMVKGLFKEKVTAITMDDLLSLNDVASSTNVFIKMDIEGYENFALDGGHKFFRCKDVIGIFMAWKWHKKSESRFKIKEFMDTFGFVPYRFIEGTWTGYKPLSWKKKQGTDFPDDVLWISTNYEYLTY